MDRFPSLETLIGFLGEAAKVYGHWILERHRQRVTLGLVRGRLTVVV